MSKLIFPEGILWKYAYTTAADFINKNDTVTSASNLYHSAKNNVIRINFDISNVTDTQSMFEECDNIKTIPQFDTSKVTNMYRMFYGCDNLISIPLLDTSNVTDMSYMFYSCGNLTSIPQFDTSKVTNMSYMFYSCGNLTSIPLLDTSNVTNIGNFFGWSTMTYLTYLGGFANLGMKSSVSGTDSTYFLTRCPNLTHESIMNVINNLYDRASAGYSVLKLSLHANTLALLSDEEKAIATNKGWTLA